jgi:hypothetical protein
MNFSDIGKVSESFGLVITFLHPVLLLMIMGSTLKVFYSLGGKRMEKEGKEGGRRWREERKRREENRRQREREGERKDGGKERGRTINYFDN